LFKLIIYLLTLIPVGIFCEEPNMNLEGSPPIVIKIAVLALLALLPFMVMLMTSFLKMVVVFSLLRNAIGVQQSPPNQALNGMALLMSIYVMFPTGVAMYDKAKTYIESTSPQALFSPESAFYMYNIIDQAKEPLKDFLKRNTAVKNTRYFYQLAYKKFPDPYRQSLSMDDFIIIVPAYITSQIKSAFEVGVLIYLPFFVIDLVTSNILLAMGMMMLSPLTIALPLKLLLIVMIDGWTLIVQGLVLSFR
jgi:type III secretion protein R